MAKECRPIGFKWKRLSLPGLERDLSLIRVISGSGIVRGVCMKKIILLMISGIWLFASSIYVASAANLTYVMPEIIKKFNLIYPDIKINLIVSSSGKLTAQILKGAPYDIFLSANMKYPSKLYKAGFAKTKPKIYAKGYICIFSLKRKLNLKNLPYVNSIALSKPMTTPYGKAAVESFKNAGIYNKIKNRLVFAQSVPAVISYVKNYADAGIISLSMIYSKNIKNLGKFYYTKINPKLYPPINQGVVLLSDKKPAKKFYNFLFSKDVKQILKKYGYQ